MMHPLQSQIVGLRRRLRWLVLVYGLASALGVALAAVLVLGGMDYLFRFQDRGLRLLSTAALLAALGWACYRFVICTLRRRYSDAALAAGVERRFPQLRNRLTSAVEFLQQSEDDPTAGAAALRRAVISEAAAEAQRVSFAEVLDPRPARQALAALAAIVLVSGGLVAWHGETCRVAVARLANPLGQTVWPRANWLALQHVAERVARGQAFDVEVVDAHGAALPAEVWVHYRNPGPDGRPVLETQPMQLVNGRMIARREHVLRPFAFRVEGGDDASMPWIDVTVIDPPAVETLAMHAIPPSYTGWAPYEAERPIRALVGTRLEFRGATNLPITAATLCLADGRKIPAQLDDARHFHLAGEAAVVVDKSQAWWITLADAQGLGEQASEHWQIEALADAAPSVVLEQPTGNVFVTPRATLPLRILTKDDLAIREVAIEYARGDRPQAAERFAVYTGPARPQPRSSAAPTAQAAIDSRSDVYRWELAGLDLPPGAEIVFRAQAADYGSGRGQSEARRIHVLTAEEFQDRMAGRQARVLAELERVLKLQQESRSQVHVLAVQVQESGALGVPDVDHLQAASIGQRSVTQALTSPQDGLPREIGEVLAEFDNNHVDSPDVRRHLQTVLAAIERLGREHLPPIARELTGVLKAAQIQLQESGGAGQGGARDPAYAAALTDARGHQDQVIATLQALLAGLGQWDAFRRFQRELGQLLREQEELARQTTELARSLLNQETPPPEQQAQRQRAGRQQLELALRLEQLLEEMQRAAAPLRQSDPQAADALGNARAEAQRLGLGGQMRGIRGDLERNHLGQAVQGQKQVAQQLHDMLAILAGQRPNETARFEDEVRQLRQRQQGLLEAARRLQSARQGHWTEPQTAALADLAGQQRSLQEAAGRAGSRWGKSPAFALALGGAASAMGEAAAHLAQHAADMPTQSAQQSAIERLAWILQALAPAENAPEQKPAGNTGNGAGQGRGEGPAIVAELKLLRLLQQAINQQTHDLQQAAGAGGLNADAQRQLANLSRQQGQLADALQELLRRGQSERGP